MCSVGSFDDCGHGGEKLGRRSGSVSGGATATACKWSAKEGGSGQWLTASRTSRSASSETVRSVRCGEGDLRRSEVEEELGSSLGAFGVACVDGDGDGDEAELGARRRGKGVAVGAVAVSGGDGHVRV